MSAQCSSLRSVTNGDNLTYLHQQKMHWRDTTRYTFTMDEKDNITVLFGGLSLLQDKLIATALQSLGENYVALPNPDFESFQTGKAFGNRGQCNPTYFTVGNLIKYLQKLRDEDGKSSEEIVKKYILVTAGGCGPCRFGMYITEYRKALRDAGFDGFRIMSFEQDKGIYQAADEVSVMNFTPAFFLALIKAILIGDIINNLGYKMRPYEVTKGSTDAAIEACRAIVSEAFTKKKNLVGAMRRCRKELTKVKLNRLQPKAKVMVMGEFWAAMTESDGNYNLHRFLEEEGVECIPQPVVNRLFISIWEAERKMGMNQHIPKEGQKKIDFADMKSRLLIKSAKTALKLHFNLYAKAIGLKDFKLPDIEALAKMAEPYYPIACEGGEGHMEVAHLIEAAEENLAHLVISVKPFGCMPSSCVSDGIQSLVSSRFPSVNFLSIETSGEGAANFYSRVQMALFKAKQAAKNEYETLTMPKVIPLKVHSFLYQPRCHKAGTSANIIASL
jgi:predicted nucleotide-binding protein (sugar kinase/HSP70/actin superfamily)